jgi:amino acid adenylation domain-containing protein
MSQRVDLESYMASGGWTMGKSLVRTASRFPDRVALDLADSTWTYATLLKRAAAVAATLQRERPRPEVPLTAVFGVESTPQFAAVAGAMLAGTGFVPLDCRLPVARTRSILTYSLANALVVDPAAAPQLNELLEGLDRRMVIIMPETSSTYEVPAALSPHRIVAADRLAESTDWQPVDVAPGSLAYLMFTSGSTGKPKGVGISHQQVEHFIRRIIDLYEFDESDRFSQLNSLGFDMSIFDYAIPWEIGAAVCGPREQHAIDSVRYVNDLGLTVWYSVPAKSIAAKQLGQLVPGAMPTLRVSAWCGEALPVDLMDAWSAAAPNSVLDNHYGPTEATVACTFYRYDADRTPADAEHGVMPIGTPYPGMQVRILDEQMRPVAPGEIGELVLVGPQVAAGYWQDPDRTAESFMDDPVSGERAYRTGDLVRQMSEGQPIRFLGRRDSQIQVLGGRVELLEVEAALRTATGADIAVAMGWDERAATASYLVAFVNAKAVDAGAVRAQLRKLLPSFAVPRVIRAVPDMPLNSNGKVDRQALRAMLDAT